MRRSLEQGADPVHDSPTLRQQSFMARHHLHPDRAIDMYDASHMIGKFVHSRRQLAPTDRQEKFLKERGEWREGMNRGAAHDLIKRIVRGLDGRKTIPSDFNGATVSSPKC